MHTDYFKENILKASARVVPGSLRMHGVVLPVPVMEGKTEWGESLAGPEADHTTLTCLMYSLAKTPILI